MRMQMEESVMTGCDGKDGTHSRNLGPWESLPDWHAPWTRPLLKLRQHWCSRLHDKAFRFHPWKITDEHGTIRCHRCKVVRGGHVGAGDAMRKAMADYQHKGLFRRPNATATHLPNQYPQ